MANPAQQSSEPASAAGHTGVEVFAMVTKKPETAKDGEAR
jgi:hypothetical protein